MLRSRPSILFLICAFWFTTAPLSALEKASRRAHDGDDSWNVSSIDIVRYYNNCTGWVWVWSGWSAGEQVGVRFDVPCGAGWLSTTWALTFSGAPAGYGFTGTISARSGRRCTDPVVASQPFLPSLATEWTGVTWGGEPVFFEYLIDITWAAPSGFTNSTGLASDHPAAGATGPAACGTCFPSNRVSNSRYFGVGGAYCPSGTALSDGVCDIEFMMDTSTGCVVDAVTDESWGRVKSLFR